MTENEAINYLRQIDPKHIECVELIDMKEVWENIPKAVSVAEKALREIQQYRAIGTVEEYREAREMQRAKKPILSAPCKSINYYLCPNCNKILNINKPFCCDCGSGIDWSEEDVRKDKE